MDQRYIASAQKAAEGIRALADGLNEMDDVTFLDAGLKAPSPVCPIPMWKLYVNKKPLEGSQWCVWCDDGGCASTNDCHLSEGSTDGCALACDCECATKWADDYWPSERLALFRAWVVERLRLMAQQRIDDASKHQGATRAGGYHEDAMTTGVIPGAAKHNGNLTSQFGRSIA